MSELIKQWERESQDHNYESWKKWYYRNRPNGVNDAVRRVKAKLVEFKDLLLDLDDDTIRLWVEDLVIDQTFIGLRFQEGIIKKVASLVGMPHRLATAGEESQGIDGFIGQLPVSVKPDMYKVEKHLREKIRAPIIYYRKGEDGIVFDVSEVILALRRK
jgi:hypothetical protein